MYVCMRSENESASHLSPPQLKGVRVISACARARVRAGTISQISSLCMFVCWQALTPTHTHTHTQEILKTQSNTRQVMIEKQHFHSSTVSQYSATRKTHTQAMKARQKRRVAGPTTDCCSNKASCIEEKQRQRKPTVRCNQTNKRKKEQTYTYTTHTSMHVGMYDCMRSESESELGNQLSGILTEGKKETCILVCLCMYVCMRSESESASHSSPPQLKGVRVISACVFVSTFVLVLFRKSLHCVCLSAGAHRDTKTQTQTHKKH
jgi:hypothetical protein